MSESLVESESWSESELLTEPEARTPGGARGTACQCHCQREGLELDSVGIPGGRRGPALALQRISDSPFENDVYGAKCKQCQASHFRLSESVLC